MGKVKFSVAVSEIRNKVGGSIYSRNRYGAYVKNYAVPTGTPSSAQVTWRSDFAVVSNYWTGLTDAQRMSWGEYAATLQRIDIFSQQYYSTAFNCFMRINLERIRNGRPITDLPAGYRNVPPYKTPTVTFDIGTSDFTFTIPSNPLGNRQAVIIRASAEYTGTRTYFKNLVRQISVVANAGTLPYNAYADWVTQYGAPVGGMRIGYELYVVSRNEGNRTVGSWGWINT